MTKNRLLSILRPGDRLLIPKSGLRLVQHHAIYLGQNREGLHLVSENKIGHGVRLITLDDFLSDAIEITKIVPFDGTNEQRTVAIKRALDKLGQPYDLILFNCESYANYVQHGHCSSKQVKNTVRGLVGLGLFALIVAAIKSE